MKFVCEHTLRGVTPQAYEELFFDETFNEAMCREVGLGRKVIRLERNVKGIKREVECVPQREVPGPIAKLIGASTLSYVEIVEYRWGTFQASWRTVPAVLPNKVDARGVYQFEATPDGCVRRVEGEIRVNVFGIGGTIERFIVHDIERSYAAAAQMTQRYIDSRQKSP